MKKLNEKKDHFIKKLPYLSSSEKEAVIEFLNKYPAYENQIDWQRTDLHYADFTKFMALQNFKTTGKKQKKSNPDIPHIYSNEMWDFYMPLSWEGGKIADSAKIGGQKAGWCIGWQESSRYFDGYRLKGTSFVMAVKKELPEGFTIEGVEKPANMNDQTFEFSKAEVAIKPYEPKFEAIKYMIEITGEHDNGYGGTPIAIGSNRGIRVWCQSDYNTTKSQEDYENFKNKVFLGDNAEELLVSWDKEYNDIVDTVKVVHKMLVLPPVSFLDDEELDFAEDDYLEMLIDQYDKYIKLPEVISGAATLLKRCIVLLDNNPLIFGIIYDTSVAKMESYNFLQVVYDFLGINKKDADAVLKKYDLSSLLTCTGRNWITEDGENISPGYNNKASLIQRHGVDIFKTVFERERNRIDSLFED